MSQVVFALKKKILRFLSDNDTKQLWKCGVENLMGIHLLMQGELELADEHLVQKVKKNWNTLASAIEDEEILKPADLYTIDKLIKVVKRDRDLFVHTRFTKIYGDELRRVAQEALSSDKYNDFLTCLSISEWICEQTKEDLYD